jgi:hypothetical protein
VAALPLSTLFVRNAAAQTFGDAYNIGSMSGTSGCGGTTSLTLKGAGGNFENNASTDNMYFCATPVSGNFTLTAHVTYISSGASAGIEIRDMQNPASASARNDMVYGMSSSSVARAGSYERAFNGTPNVALQQFQSLDVQEPDTFYPGPTTGIWLKLTRIGDEISLYYSPETTSAASQHVPDRTAGSAFEWRAAGGAQALVGLSSGTPYVGFAMTGPTGSVVTFESIDYTTTPEEVLSPNYMSGTPTPMTTWFGNTFPGAGAYTIYRGQALTVDPSGNVYVQGGSEQESVISLTNAGAFNASYLQTHYNSNIGIAFACGQVWTAQSNYNSQGYGVAYYTPDGHLNGIANGPSGNNVQYAGLASNAGAACGKNLYAIEEASPSKIDVIDTSTGAYSSTITLSDGGLARYIALDNTGSYLWAILSTNGVQKYNLSGAPQGSPITDGLTSPAAVAVDNQGNVYITDPAAADQRVHVYTSAGASVRTLGNNGGPHAQSIPGSIEYNGLDHPEGIAIDSGNNVYVASSGPFTCNPAIPGTCSPAITGRAPNFGNSGMTLRKYNVNANSNTVVGTIGTSNLAWQTAGLDYIDGASIDPTTMTDAYDKFHHYTLNYANLGTGNPVWAYTGDLLDDTDYPSDPRLLDSGRDVGTLVRYINGYKFLFVSTANGNPVNIYRFLSNSGTSELTAPYARFNAYTQPGGGKNALEIWVDSNLNGIIDSSNPYCENGVVSGGGEESCTAAFNHPSNDFQDWYMDLKGNIWTISFATPSAPAIVEFPVTGSGYPSWGVANEVTWAVPAAFIPTGSETTYPLRLLFDTTASNGGSMFISGYTSNSNPGTYTPNPPPMSGEPTDLSKDTTGDGNGGVGTGFVGTQILRYDNWLNASKTANLTANCSIVLASPPEATPASGNPNGPRAFDISHGLLVTETDFANRFDYYYAYDPTCTGSTSAPLRYSWLTGPEVGATSGTLDSAQALNIQYVTTNGLNKYVTTAEEGGGMKIIMTVHADGNVSAVP